MYVNTNVGGQGGHGPLFTDLKKIGLFLPSPKIVSAHRPRIKPYNLCLEEHISAIYTALEKSKVKKVNGYYQGGIAANEMEIQSGLVYNSTGEVRKYL